MSKQSRIEQFINATLSKCDFNMDGHTVNFIKSSITELEDTKMFLCPCV